MIAQPITGTADRRSRDPTRTRARRPRAIRSISARHAGSAIESSTSRRSPPARRHAASASRSITSHSPCTIASTSTLPDASPFDEMSNIGGARNVRVERDRLLGHEHRLGPRRGRSPRPSASARRGRAGRAAAASARTSTRARRRARAPSRARPAARGARRVQVSRLSISAETRAASAVMPLPCWVDSERPIGRIAANTGMPIVSSPVSSAIRVIPARRAARREPPPRRRERRRAVRAVAQPRSARRAPGRAKRSGTAREHTAMHRRRAVLARRPRCVARCVRGCRPGRRQLRARATARAAMSIAARPTAGTFDFVSNKPERRRLADPRSAAPRCGCRYAQGRVDRQARLDQPDRQGDRASCGS